MHDLAIGLCLLRNPTCAQHYDDSMLSILANGHLPFHLSTLKATFIKAEASLTPYSLQTKRICL